MTRRTLSAICAIAAIGLLTPVPAAATAAPVDEPKPGEIVAVSNPAGDDPAIAAGEDGQLFVADTEEGRVWVTEDDGTRKAMPGVRPGPQAYISAIAARGGDLYVADTRTLRRVSNGSVTTLAKLPGVATAITADGDGNVYIAAGFDYRIVKVRSGKVSTLIGGGDKPVDEVVGKAARDADLEPVAGIAADSAGSVYFTMEDSSVVYRVDPRGVLHRFAGTSAGFAGDGGPAVEAQLSDLLSGMDVDGEDNVYVADAGNSAVRVVDREGTISTVPFPGLRGTHPYVENLTVSRDGRIYAYDGSDILMRTAERPESPVRPDVGPIAPSRVAGAEPGTVASVAHQATPNSMSIARDGSLYYRDTKLNEVRRVAKDGTASTVAAVTGFDPVLDVAAGPAGSVYVSGRHEHAGDGLHRVDPDGSVVRIAGGGALQPVSRDDVAKHPAIMTDLGPISRVLTAPDGDLLLHTFRYGIWRLGADGRLHDVAVIAPQDAVHSKRLAVAPDGSLIRALPNENRVVKVAKNGENTTVAGSGRRVSDDDNGDGGPATEAAVQFPTAVALDDDGRLYVATFEGIRRVGTDGVIETVHRFPPEGGDMTISSMVVDGNGDLYFSQPKRGEINVLAAPAQVTEPFPWSTVVWLGAGTLVVGGLLAGWLIYRKRTRRT